MLIARGGNRRNDPSAPLHPLVLMGRIWFRLGAAKIKVRILGMTILYTIAPEHPCTKPSDQNRYEPFYGVRSLERAFPPTLEIFCVDQLHRGLSVDLLDLVKLAARIAGAGIGMHNLSHRPCWRHSWEKDESTGMIG